MAKEKPSTKQCKHCKTEIDYTAKVCPQCRKKQGANGCLIAVVVFIALALLGSCFGGKSSESDTKESTSTRTENSSSTTSATSEAVTETTTEPAIEYAVYSVDDMMAELKENALKASDKYDKQYVEITGKLGTIDSSGKYITLMPMDDDWAFVGVQCYIKNDDQKSKVMELSKGDTVTLKGKIKSVGEVLGYSLDIDEMK